MAWLAFRLGLSTMTRLCQESSFSLEKSTSGAWTMVEVQRRVREKRNIDDVALCRSNLPGTKGFDQSCDDG